jgi:hypothetical protein
MQANTLKVLGWLGVVNGATLVAVPRALSLDDPFGDKARVFSIAGISLCVIGLVLLLGIAERGKDMEAKQSRVLHICLGIGLGLLGAYLNLSSVSKSLGFLSLPLTLVATVLITIGLRRR